MAEINEVQVGQEVFTIGGSGGGVNYSTTEQDTGLKWIDGKPIYKKTVDIGALPNNSSKLINHNVSNIDVIIDIVGFSRRQSDGLTTPLPYVNMEIYGVCVECSKTQVCIYTKSDKTAFYAYVTIQYTKTTDTPS